MVSTLQHFIWATIILRLFELLSNSKLALSTYLVFLVLTQLPDMDFPIYLVHKNSVDHRTRFHNLFAILIIGLLGSIFISLPLALLAASIHLMLDLFDGRGVPLLFPISKKRQIIYKLGKEYDFPLKVFYEGNPYLTSISIALLVIMIIL